MVNVFGRGRPATASPTCRSTTSASSTGSGPAPGPDHAAAVRRPQRPPRRARHQRPLLRRARTAADLIAVQRAYARRRRRRRQQPQPGRDHRPARPGPGRVPRRLPDLRDARPPAARLRHRGQPGPVARPGPAASATRRSPTTPYSRWTGGWRACHADHRNVRAGAEDHPGQAGTVDRSLHQRRRHRRAGRPSATDGRPAYGTPRFGAGEPKTDDVLKCQLKPLRRADYPVTFTAAPVAGARAGLPRRACATTASRASTSRPTTPWHDLPERRRPRHLRRAPARSPAGVGAFSRAAKQLRPTKKKSAAPAPRPSPAGRRPARPELLDPSTILQYGDHDVPPSSRPPRCPRRSVLARSA